jgi:agmatinase
MPAMNAFDPNAAARPGSGVFGLPHDESESALVLVPVPFDATTSYRDGTRDGPAAILEASRQVDLFDLQNGRAYERGIHMQAADPEIVALAASARARATPVIAGGGAGTDDAAAVAEVDAACARVNDIVARRTADLLGAGKLVGVVGGDHAVPFGAIATAAAHWPGLGILHVDAHADLRRAYEGFEWSHASIMDNVLRKVPGVARIAQVGIRDLCEAEHEAIRASGGRVMTWFDLDWRRRLGDGERLGAMCDEVIAALPQAIWVSFDIDGLDPASCPHTGTPVPGGLAFAEACLLLEAVARSGRRIVGFDLCEVAPGPDGDEWDANVGARVLYKLCGFCLRTS